MDNNNEDDGQHNIDNEDNVIAVCLRNPIVLRKIFEHISSTELLRVSFVSKLWKDEARSLMRRRGNLIADVRSNKLPGERCETVVAFMSDLPNLGGAPISGITFDMNYPHRHHLCSMAREDQIPIHAENLLDQLSLKSVSVYMHGNWERFTECPAFLLAKKVIQQFCGALEELQLTINDEPQDYFDNVLQACYFSRLKILGVTFNEFNEDTENYLRALLSRAPNLQSLRTDWDINSVLHLLQGTSVEFVYTMPVPAPFDQIPDNFISAIRPEHMVLQYAGRGFNFERFNRIAPILLQAPHNRTLRYLNIDAVLAVPLMCYGIRLPNVKILWMEIGRTELIEQRILNIVQKFDFTRIFPSLDKVYIVSENKYVHGFPPEHINALVDRANTCLTDHSPDRAARIKKLILSDWRPCGVAAQFFVDMFPNIKTLDVTIDASSPNLFGSIWNWLDLNELEVEGNVLPTTGNLDSAFCGIFPEEVEELRLKDDEYLKQVHIVPVMPSLTCLKNLKTISIYHQHNPDDSFGDETFMFSKVTALLAFAKLRTLVVNLNISAPTCPPAMAHLEPYVSITSDLVADED